jgi:GAF domain-containing protein
LLTAVASQVATAIYNASQFERVASAQKEAEARLMETQALQRLSQSLAGELEAGKIMNIFFKACTQVIGFEYVEFFMIDQQRQWIKTVAGVGVSAQKLQDKGHSLHSNDITADIIRSGKTEVLTGWDERLDRAIFEAEGHANWVRVFVPVKLRQETIGLVEAGYNKSAHSVIDDRQVQLLHTFIDQTVISLENAQRYEARQKDVIREQTIREITEKLRSATNLKELARATAEELGTRLSAGHVVVKLGTELQGNETAVETVKGPDYV